MRRKLAMLHSKGPDIPTYCQSSVWNPILASLESQSTILACQVAFLFHLRGTRQTHEIPPTKDMLLCVGKSWHKFSLRAGYHDSQEIKDAKFPRSFIFFEHPQGSVFLKDCSDLIQFTQILYYFFFLIYPDFEQAEKMKPIYSLVCFCTTLY